MRIKKGVKLANVSTQMVLASMIIDQVYRSLGYECTITSCSEGVHSKNSKHYVGDGMDFRISIIMGTSDAEIQDKKENLRNKIAESLGENYDVVLEKTHIHCEYQPK